MIFTMGQAYTFCRPHIDAGTCNQTLAYSRINEAIRRLLPKVNASRLKKLVRMTVRNSEFALPREAEKIEWVDVNGTPASVFSRPYEFLSGGPGDFAYQGINSSKPQVVFRGEAPYMFPLPSIIGGDDDNQTNDADTNTDDDDYPDGFILAAFSEFQEDVGKEITVMGADVLAMDIRVASGSLSAPGLTIKINRFAGGVEGTISGTWDELEHSAQNFRDIYQIHKPVTRGYITIYAIYEETNEMFLVGKYHPDETIPMFSRYRLTSKPYNRKTPQCDNVLMLVKMRYVELTRDTDIIPFDSLDAIKNMCISIGYENAKELQNAILFEQNAIRLLNDQIEQKEVKPSAPIVIDLLRECSGRPLYRGGGLQ